VVSQQFDGIEETFYGLVVKPESTLVIVEVESTNVESTDVVEFTDVSGSSGGTLNLLEHERFVVARVEPGGDARDRLTTRGFDRWHEETVALS